MKTFSVDAETNGLYGESFAIAAIVSVDGQEISSFEGRIPDEQVSNQWARDNVLPAIADMGVTHMNSQELEEAFWKFWQENKDAIAIAHCGSPVESGLFRRCIERQLEDRQFSGPFPLHEVGTVLEALGENPRSVDEYVAKHELPVPFDGLPHHPRYDAAVAAVVWEDGMKKLTQQE